MNDKELADKVVALGVAHENWSRFFVGENFICYMDKPQYFVRDPRVAMVCLQRWPTTINTEHLDMTLDEMLRDPRAIIEAYVTAAENSND